MSKKFSFRWPLIILALLIIAGLFYYRLRSFNFDTDLVGYLPKNDPVLTDASYVIRHLPYQDKVVIDISMEKADRDALVEASGYIEERLVKSGFFKKIGIDDTQMLFPELITHIVKNLPVMFTEAELRQKIEPLLSRKNINETLLKNLETLGSLDGIGQAEYLTIDPLGFKNIVLWKLSDLAPTRNAEIYNGRILSSDGKHLLVIAEMKGSGMDLKASEAINKLITGISTDINKTFASKGYIFTLNPVGAYRAVVDNETITKNDTERAVTISTIIIALLLIVGFPRPLIGLLALVPSIIGTVIAFIVYSFIHDSLSLLAIGFGGAIISFTVDYGITYLLFLDRPHETYGLNTTKEVWSLGLLAMLTTAVSFVFLFVSGFPVLAQIGEFSALGVVFTYICVHAFFPVMFPVLPPAKRRGVLPIHKFVSLMSSKVNYKFYAAVVFCIVMAFFAKPEFHINLDSMNSVSKETLYSENLVLKIWGDLYTRVYLMTEGGSVKELQANGDRVTDMLAKDVGDGVINPAFIPSMIYPGKERMDDNFKAWRKFWNAARVKELKKNIRLSSEKAGFSKGAFNKFFSVVEQKGYSPADIPPGLYSLFGISKISENKWMQFSMISTAKGYNGERFYTRYTGHNTRIFDPNYFSERLGKMLLNGFIRMAVIVGAISLLVAFFYLFDWQLTLVSVLPTIFSLICTFGTLKLLRQPLGIPTIMVTVAVIGMGTDYAIYFVRGYQRYLDESRESLKLVHTSVLLSFATTFAGFGLLAFSKHTLLKSAGMCLGLGIGYSFIGAVCIVPYLLRLVYKPVKHPAGKIVPGSKDHFRRVMARYRHLEAYPRFFARFKILLDPMFPKLAEFVRTPKKILDIGCGYGVPSAWLLELYPEAVVRGFDPDKKRVFIASRILGPGCTAEIASAPELPSFQEKFDTALLLDMAHYLSDEDFKKTLKWANARLAAKGRLIMRITIPSGKAMPWERWLENTRVRVLRIKAYFRNEATLKKLIRNAGFTVTLIEPSGKKREETWIIADKIKSVK